MVSYERDETGKIIIPPLSKSRRAYDLLIKGFLYLAALVTCALLVTSAACPTSPGSWSPPRPVRSRIQSVFCQIYSTHCILSSSAF